MSFSKVRALTGVMNDHDDLTRRLRDLGGDPVDPATASAHLTAMAATPAKAPRRFGRLAVAGAALTGFLVGGSGLAVAGAVPAPVEDAVNKVMEVTGFRNRGECVSQAAKAGDAAARDTCPKGRASGAGGKADAKARLDAKKNDGDPCTGPPPWAGRGLEAREERQAHREAFRNATPEEREALRQQRADDREAERQQRADARQAHRDARAQAGCAETEANDANDSAADAAKRQAEAEERRAEAEAEAGAGSEADVTGKQQAAEPAEPPADTPPETPVADPPAADPATPAADPATPDERGTEAGPGTVPEEPEPTS